MRLRIVVDQAYWRTPDGSIWTRMPPAYSFFESHLDHFEEIEVVARTQEAPAPPEHSRLASGRGIRWISIPRYIGLRDFVAKSIRVISAMANAISPSHALLLRGPSHLANLESARSRHLPCAIEVLGDPSMLYANHALHRAWFTQNLRRQCRIAIAAGFVSAELERRYPSPNPHRLLDIELPPEAYAPAARVHPPDGPLHIVTVGGFDHPVKGHDVLIRAAARLPRARLTIVGAGGLRSKLEGLARECGVRVCFAGQLGGPEAVRRVLETATIFVLASRSEGMPRALIEAMALGIPAVTSRVGGIPELLPARQLVPSGDFESLAKTIDATVRDPARYAELSGRGITIARGYSLEAQSRNRRRFLQDLRDAADLRFRGRQVYAC